MIFSSLPQPKNAHSPILVVTPAGIIALVKFIQLENAKLPISVTLFEMIILIKSVQFLNAFFSITP